MGANLNRNLGGTWGKQNPVEGITAVTGTERSDVLARRCHLLAKDTTLAKQTGKRTHGLRTRGRVSVRELAKQHFLLAVCELGKWKGRVAPTDSQPLGPSSGQQ